MTQQTEQLRRQRLEMLANALQPHHEVLRTNRYVPAKLPWQMFRGCSMQMHCEHLAAYYASRRRLKGIRFDAYNKMAREYHRAARDADYAATFWRP